MVGRSIIHSIYFAKPLTQPAPWGTDSELSLNYKALKDQTISIHTVHPNLREGFTIITVWGFAQAHCKYSHTCYRWAGMCTFVSCYQDIQSKVISTALLVPLSMVQAPHTHRQSTITGFNPNNNKGDHNITRPKDLTMESPKNIRELGKTLNKILIKKY